MNRLILKEMNVDKIVYLYHPEDKETFGEIEYLFSDNQAHIVKKAEDDETGYYARKATLKVENYVSANNLPLNSIQAWY